MNSLSWLLYVADVLPTISGVLSFFCALSMLASTVAYFITMAYVAEVHGEEKEVVIKANKITGRISLCSLFALLIALLIPSKETFYLIARSEAGEHIVESPRANELMNKINKVIDIQLEQLTTKK